MLKSVRHHRQELRCSILYRSVSSRYYQVNGKACRGFGEKLILNGECTKKPADCKSFLSNDENKIQFTKVLLRLWSSDCYASRLQGRRVIFVSEGAAYLLTSSDGKKTITQELSQLKS